MWPHVCMLSTECKAVCFTKAVKTYTTTLHEGYQLTKRGVCCTCQHPASELGPERSSTGALVYSNRGKQISQAEAGNTAIARHLAPVSTTASHGTGRAVCTAHHRRRQLYVSTGSSTHHRQPSVLITDNSSCMCWCDKRRPPEGSRLL
jgi:hypothetical protein